MKSDYVFFPVVERECVWIDKAGGKNDTGKKAIVACVDYQPQLIGLVGEDYKLLLNIEVWDVISEVIKKYSTHIKMYCDDNLGRTFFDIHFDDVKCFLGGSAINFRAIFWNGYAGASLGVYAGGINAFCTNGMISGVYETTWKRHTKGLTVDVVKLWLEDAIACFHRQTVMWEKYCDMHISADNALDLFETFDNRRAVDLMELFTIKYVPQYGQTVWAALNCMTDVATHFEQYKKRKVTSGNASSTMFSKLIRAEKIVGDYYEVNKAA